MYLVNVSYILILHPSKGLYSSFSKKRQIKNFLVNFYGPYAGGTWVVHNHSELPLVLNVLNAVKSISKCRHRHSSVSQLRQAGIGISSPESVRLVPLVTD
jgi:hypothetical protein